MKIMKNQNQKNVNETVSGNSEAGNNRVANALFKSFKDSWGIPATLASGVAAVILVCLAVSHFLSADTKLESVSGASVFVDTKEMKPDYSMEAQVLNKLAFAGLEHSKRIQNAYMDFKHKFESSNVCGWDTARKSIPEIVDDFKSISTIRSISWAYAKDFVKVDNKTDRVEKKIQKRIISKVLPPCEEARAELEFMLENFQRTLSESEVKYQLDLCAIVEEAKSATNIRPDFLLSLCANLQKSGEISKTIVADNLGAAFSGTVEALTIKQAFKTCSKVVVKTIAKTVGKRAVATVATSAGCAVADGPLPIGDAVGAVVFVAGSAWTAYDINQARKVIPAELGKSLHDAVNEHEKSVKDYIYSQAILLTDAYAEALKISAQKMQTNLIPGNN